MKDERYWSLYLHKKLLDHRPECRHERNRIARLLWRLGRTERRQRKARERDGQD